VTDVLNLAPALINYRNLLNQQGLSFFWFVAASKKKSFHMSTNGYKLELRNLYQFWKRLTVLQISLKKFPTKTFPNNSWLVNGYEV